MSKLNQIIAVEKSLKGKSHSALTEAYHKAQKAAIFNGISRTYSKRDDEGEDLPPEVTKVTLTVDVLIKDVMKPLAELLDVTATKDYANCQATADVVVGGATLLKGAPVTYLLFLEKKLTDIHTFVSKLPVLDPTEVWHYDPINSCYASEPQQTHRTKKIPRVLQKAPATDKHPAQVEVVHEDTVVGYWKTVKFSGGLPADKIKSYLDKIEALQRAVKFAREEANMKDADQKVVGEKILNFIFG